MSARDAALQEDVSLTTVLKLNADLGKACLKYQHEAFRGLTPEYLQLDELCTFVGNKANKVWIWKAIDPDTKLVPCFRVGTRDLTDALLFVEDLASRIISAPQVTSDGWRAYVPAVMEAFGPDIKFGTIMKPKYPKHGNTDVDEDGEKIDPNQPKEVKRTVISGNPDQDKISTSLMERENATMRSKMGRLVRKSLGFSKDLQALKDATALYYMTYNFAHQHKTLRCSPAMQARVADKLWSMEDIAALMD
jgi:IS1 family transposase